MLLHLKLLKLPLLIVLILLVVESLLEYRHYRNGYITPIFGNPNVKTEQLLKSGEPVLMGPTKDYPFRSSVLKQPSGNGLRIWIASASHAEHDRLPSDKIFPNMICQHLKLVNQDCEVINGSKAGLSIKGDIDLLNAYAPKLKPDYVLLYQMSMEIEGMQKKFLMENSSVADNNATGIIDFSYPKKIFQNASANTHLTEYLGGYIRLNALLKERFPKAADDYFHDELLSFIRASRHLNAAPVLMTFAGSHDKGNIDNMDYGIKTNFVRYAARLSVNGWLESVSRFNQIIIKTASEEGVPLIDLAKKLNGKPEYFVDFVHFGEQGHQAIAKFIAKDMSKIINATQD